MIRDDLSIDDPDPNMDSPPQRSWMRFLPAGIALGAIALFGGVVGYTYMSRGTAGDGPVPLVRADQRPAKVKPDSPGGMDVPHQDKEIYARLAQSEAPPPPPAKVERLLPPPEAPMPKPAATPAPLPPVAVPAMPEVKPPANAVAVIPPPAPAEAKPAEPPKTAAAKPVETKPAEPPKTTAAKPAVETKQLATIAPAAGAAGTAGAFRIQIASLRTTEDATKSWEKLKTTNPDLLGKLSGNVVRADLGDKGTFYRVIAGPLGDRDAADTLCTKLKQRNVGCLVVKP